MLVVYCSDFDNLFLLNRKLQLFPSLAEAPKYDEVGGVVNGSRPTDTGEDKVTLENSGSQNGANQISC